MDKRFSSAFLCAVLEALMLTTTGFGRDTLNCTIVNGQDKPVYATVVELEADPIYQSLGGSSGDAIDVLRPDGTPLAVTYATENGRRLLRIYTDLGPFERLDLSIRRANHRPDDRKICTARWDADTSTGTLRNGLLRLDFTNGQWGLSFERDRPGVSGSEDLGIVKECALDVWLDTINRGRIMGQNPKQLGMIHMSEAELVNAESSVKPDGSAELVLVRCFASFGRDIEWTETFTLPAGRPVMIYRTRYENKGNEDRYLAYVELGGGVRGRYGRCLQQQPRIKYEDVNSPDPILLDGLSNGFTRIAWRGERAWLAVESASGCGIGFSTLEQVTRNLLGSTVWDVGPNHFLVCLIDARQGNFPYVLKTSEPLETGLAFVASSGGLNMWDETRKVFRAVTREKVPDLNTSYAVYLDGRPVRYAEVKQFTGDFSASSQWVVSQDDPETHSAALEIDFNRPYRLTVRADQVPQGHPVQIWVSPADDSTKTIDVLTMDRAGRQEVDFSAVTGWKGKRAFVLTAVLPKGATIPVVELGPAPFAAPELSSPFDNASITDLATYFRWKRVEEAMNYELQMSLNENFTNPQIFGVCSEIKWPIFIPQDDQLPVPGNWYWRVRAVEQGRPGAWSAVRRLAINNDHPLTPLKHIVSPEHPLFTMEANGVRDFSKFRTTIPSDIKPYMAFLTGEKFNLIELLKPLAEIDQKFFLRTHHPSAMTTWTPLADVEVIFQTYPNAMGAMGGESLSPLFEKGDGHLYQTRLLKLCAKYGLYYHEGDGTYPDIDKWWALMKETGSLVEKYGDYLIFSQKNNIVNRQFVTQSSILGLYVSDVIHAQGAWEDGGWYWQQIGFRRLGQIYGRRGGDVNMPRIFWDLTFLMGVSRGCTVFSIDGQTGTVRVPTGYKLSEKGLPKSAPDAAHWTSEGELTDTFNRFIAPFIRGVVNHRMIPDKQQVRDRIRYAVYNDGMVRNPDADPYYPEYWALFSGTYGFLGAGDIPGELFEYFPNTGRYYYIPILPQGYRDIGQGIRTLALSKLRDPERVKTLFNQAYPKWYDGDALVTLVGDTLTIMNSYENQDEVERYSVPLNRGSFVSVSGTSQPHSYVMGKFEQDDSNFWMQANSEYPGRDTKLRFVCETKPVVDATPAEAVQSVWDAAGQALELTLSHEEGAVEIRLTCKP